MSSTSSNNNNSLLTTGLGWKGPGDYPKGALVLLGSQSCLDAQETILPVLITGYLRPGGAGPLVKSSVLYISTTRTTLSPADRGLYKRLLGMPLELLEAQERLRMAPFTAASVVSLIRDHYEAVVTQKEGHSLLVVIEGLDSLGLTEMSMSHCSQRDRWTLIQELVQLAPELKEATILISIHTDLHELQQQQQPSYENALVSESRLWRCLIGHAHTVIKTGPLGSGLSRKIHGQLDIFRGGCGYNAIPPVLARSWLYFSNDQTIQLLSKGTSFV